MKDSATSLWPMWLGAQLCTLTGGQVLEPHFPHVHSKGGSRPSYLTSFRSQTPGDNLMTDTN